MAEVVDLHEIVSAVAGMRDAQRSYFKALRDTPEKRVALVASKEAERRVDELVRRYRDAQATQQGRLFK